MTQCMTQSSSKRRVRHENFALNNQLDAHCYENLGLLFSFKMKQQQFSQAFYKEMCVPKQQNKKKEILQKRQQTLEWI